MRRPNAQLAILECTGDLLELNYIAFKRSSRLRRGEDRKRGEREEEEEKRGEEEKMHHFYHQR